MKNIRITKILQDTTTATTRETTQSNQVLKPWREGNINNEWVRVITTRIYYFGCRLRMSILLLIRVHEKRSVLTSGSVYFLNSVMFILKKIDQT